MRSTFRYLQAAQSGSVAVEFALVSPIFIALLAGIVAYGSIISEQNSIQQIAAEAARSSVGGLSDAEREALSRAYIDTAVTAYPLVDPAKLTVSTDAPSATTFRVSVRYDMSESFVYRLLNGLPLPSSTVHRSAVVQRGGF